MSDAGEGSLLQKGPLPHAPSSLPPKTFDWWGGSTKGVSSNTFCYGDEAALPFHRHAA